MKRYAIWNKQDDIFTLGKDETGKQHWTAQEYIDSHAPWAVNPNVKVIVGGGVVNGTVFMEFEATVDFYKNLGAEITDGMTDEQVLQAIEDFENTPPVDPATVAENEALELIKIMLGED